MTFRVVILGAGIFASSAHAGAIRNAGSEKIVCQGVWSRRIESASILAKSLDCPAYAGEDDLEKLLTTTESSDTIDAFIVCLPIDVQPAFVERILKAGKHVLSEKPIAPTVAIAKTLVQLYQNVNVHWSVAENYRYEPAMLAAKAAVEKHCGDHLLLASLLIRGPFTTDNQFYQTSWRKDPTYQGGFFIDAFPHGVAALRMIVGEPISVSAITSKHSEHLPDIDTLSAHVQYVNKNDPNQKPVQGVIAVTYACQDLKFELEVTGNKGTVVVTRNGPGYTIRVNNEKEPTFVGFGGIDAEFVAFADACSQKEDGVEDINTPEEALKDIIFVEALLSSGRQGGKLIQIADV